MNQYEKLLADVGMNVDVDECMKGSFVLFIKALCHGLGLGEGVVVSAIGTDFLVCRNLDPDADGAISIKFKEDFPELVNLVDGDFFTIHDTQEEADAFNLYEKKKLN